MVAAIKAAVWRILAWVYFVSGLAHVRHRGRVTILTYHRIVSNEMARSKDIQPGMLVLAHTLEVHMAYLRKRFEIISLAELLELWRTNRLKSDRSYCVVTFDDGWRDNYQFAFPILVKHRIPATIFLATDYIGTARWFWPDQLMVLLEKAREHTTGTDDRKAVSAILAETIGISQSLQNGNFIHKESREQISPDDVVELCKGIETDRVQVLIDRLSCALRLDLPDERVLLNWDEVREMAGKGVTFGSHSGSHRIMTQIPLSEVKTELIDSRKTMLEQGIKPVPVFCYPNGNFDRDIQELVRESGYLAAVGCEVGLERDRLSDLFALKRISLHEDSSASVPLLAFALSGFR